jgi:hypothetical protein
MARYSHSPTEGLKNVRLEDSPQRRRRPDAQSITLCREAAIVQALYLERRQHCRIQIIEGPAGELIDRETFEREHLT